MCCMQSAFWQTHQLFVITVLSSSPSVRSVSRGTFSSSTNSWTTNTQVRFDSFLWEELISRTQNTLWYDQIEKQNQWHEVCRKSIVILTQHTVLCFKSYFICGFCFFSTTSGLKKVVVCFSRRACFRLVKEECTYIGFHTQHISLRNTYVTGIFRNGQLLLFTHIIHVLSCSFTWSGNLFETTKRYFEVTFVLRYTVSWFVFRVHMFRSFCVIRTLHIPVLTRVTQLRTQKKTQVLRFDSRTSLAIGSYWDILRTRSVPSFDCLGHSCTGLPSRNSGQRRAFTW